MKLLPGITLTLSEVKTNIEVVRQLSGGKRMPLCIDISQIGSITREARQYSAGESVEEVISALAILIGSVMTQVLGNLWLGINKPVFPSRLFTSRDEAMRWLRNYKKDPER